MRTPLLYISICEVALLLDLTAGIFALSRFLLNAPRRRYLLPAALLCLAELIFLGLAVAVGAAVPDPRLRDLFPRIPVSAAAAVLVLFAALDTAELVSLHRLARSVPSSGALKQCLDELPTGFACCMPDGRPVLCNAQMHRISRLLTGQTFVDGSIFRDALSPEHLRPGCRILHGGPSPVIALPNGRTYLFHTGPLPDSSDGMREFTVTDVTVESGLTHAMQVRSRELAERNRRLQEHGALVDRVAAEEEILRAKANVHDNMGHLLLATRHALQSEDGTLPEELLTLWRTNIRLLSRSGEQVSSTSRLSDLASAARTIGAEIHFSGAIPPRGSRAVELLCGAAHECLTNMVSHADGSVLTVSGTEEELCWHIRITNDGTPPASPVIEGGGLSNVRRSIESAGGTMETVSAPAFELKLTLPKE